LFEALDHWKQETLTASKEFSLEGASGGALSAIFVAASQDAPPICIAKILHKSSLDKVKLDRSENVVEKWVLWTFLRIPNLVPGIWIEWVLRDSMRVKWWRWGFTPHTRKNTYNMYSRSCFTAWIALIMKFRKQARQEEKNHEIQETSKTR
jgi:hypothetical protein